ncbi:bifunctional 3-deoxy-7-phosphoheptulonate synthase/chorismate mutase [Ignavibacterium sp.]|jgi:chorismate mutase/prephenate dehydratase|uniref:bifunctional 3-deoxy-7-phosphoheptulonate synthase/chorismate mutase n=1 Tax=Ignavibacterium sp. TaxID=2651167 RepID=UPI0025BFABA6|nr:bifunctional 3-deoxy-7-phosphoheptulonate synthase/chorismate mutase [Ignavibacterium sp.]
MEDKRHRINLIDEQIIKLLSERRNLSKQIAQLKDLSSSEIRDRSREKEVLSHIIKLAKAEGLDTHLVSKIFSEIIEDSVNIQKKYFISKENQSENDIIRVAIQGIEGSYSYLAANNFFNDKNLHFIFNKSFEEAIDAVENDEADYAFLPIENTTSGSINEVYDALLKSNLSIVGEEIFKVSHCLLANAETSVKNIRKIFTHYQAARQCSEFLKSLPNVEVEYFEDTAKSVQKIKEEGRKDFAAIASKETAEIFDVVILKESIANQEGNYTRFWVLSKNPIQVDERIPAKVSLIMATAHKAGSLVEALSVFRDYSVNMTKLQSRPILGNPWEEMFYVDFQGNIKSPRIQDLIDDLGKYTRFLKVLGCYPEKEIERTKIESKDIPVFETFTAEYVSPKKDDLTKTTSKISYKLASREYKNEDTIIKVKDITIGGGNFVVIAGPCSVESAEQILSCAKEVKESFAHILRGGCFKPRTSPYAFQGLGYEALDLLKHAGEQFDLPIITEVLSIEQVEKVAEKSDILQIGARNMQNFPLLAEVGKSFRPVLLKRGMMASIDELLNAAEYILAKGNRQVMLCERGIRTFETATRNTLDLSAIPVLKELTHLPVIVDPSHAVGERNKVTPLAKAAKAVGADGLMIEIHPDPEKALSDGMQSLYFGQFRILMKEISK